MADTMATINPIIPRKDNVDNQFRQSSVSRYTIGDSITEQLHSLKMSSPTNTPTSRLIKETYEIVPITEHDIEDTIHFLRTFFFKDEPLNIAQNLLDDEHPTCQELEDFCVESLKENVSLMAIAPNGQLLGVCINAVSRRNKCIDESGDCSHPKFKNILKLLYTVDKQADVFGQFPHLDCTMDVKILSVDDAMRGRGIAKALMERTRMLAKELGYQMMRVDCTSHYSAKAVAALGYKCVYTLKYADYQENGKPIFTPEHPHNEVKVYVKEI